MKRPKWEWIAGDEEYYDPQGPLGSTQLIAYHKSPETYAWRFVHGKEREETDALRFGRAFHLAVLEPHRFDEEVCAPPKGMRWDLRTKQCKEFKALNADRMILSRKEWERLKAMQKNVMENPIVGHFLTEPGCPEVGYRWVDGRTGLACRCKFDWLTVDEDGRLTVVDLKTTKDAFDFGSSAWRNGYHIQAAHYLQGLSHATGKSVDDMRFIFAAVGKEAPHSVISYEPEPEFYNAGMARLFEVMDGIAWGKVNDRWEDPRTQTIQRLGVPNWAGVVNA